MFNRQRMSAIVWTSALLAACGGGSGSTGLRGPVQGNVTVTVTSGADSPGAVTNASSASTGTRSLSVDAGTTGLAHDLQVFEGASYTAELRDCDGETDTRCTFQGETAGMAFGAPSPLSVGGVAVCLLVDYDSDLSGALDLETGELSQEARVGVRVHLSTDISRPCPACVPSDGDPRLDDTGLCVGGPDEGKPCTVDALADPGFLEFRGTSFACRPEGQAIGAFTTTGGATTGDFVLGVTASSPRCSALGWSDRECLCAVCDDPEATPCRADTNCPTVDERPGVCGVSSRGLPTQQNFCLDGVCTPTGESTGVCENGPVDSRCARQPFRTCLMDSDCPAPDDTCISSARSCFPDRIELTGSPDAFVDGVAHPTLVGGFCAGTLGSAAVDHAGGFPGPVSYVWPARVVVELRRP
jgi:hypothetical protein